MLAPVQLLRVVYGTMSAGTISGMYSHTTGPSVKPKLIMNTYKEVMTRTCWPVVLLCIATNAIPIIVRTMKLTPVPSCSKIFLPTFLRIYEVQRQAMNCVPIKNTCIHFDQSGLFTASSMIWPPYKTTTLTPHICCRKAKCIATIIHSFFDFETESISLFAVTIESISAVFIRSASALLSLATSSTY
jgi:hypothetical protein